VINVGEAVETALVSTEVQAEDSERGKDQAEEELVMDASTSAMVPDVEDPFAKVASVYGTRAGEVVTVPHHSKGISHDAVCGLLERLQDVSLCFARLIGSFINGVSNFHVRLK
jgi:hypothetical protein